MALPASGAISFNNINVELGVSGTTQASLGQASYRTLAGVPSGAISLSNFYGKANQFAFTISSNQTNANLATLATTAGWNGTTKVVATIGSGVYISSNSTGTPALTISGSFPGGVELINNGYIVGMGGAGGSTWAGAGPGYDGNSGGPALSVSTTSSITNNGTIAGGGGGGGGGATRYNTLYKENVSTNRGGSGGRSSAAANSAGGYGYGGYGYSGTVSAAGARNNGYGNYGGAGGSWGASGEAGYASAPAPWPSGAGGSGGAAVTGNSNITWVATGTRLGSIS